MIQIYNRIEAVKRMNRLAAAGIPFLFVIDYKQQHSYIEETEKVNPACCRYCFNGIGNDDGIISHCTQEIEWHCAPPSPAQYQKAFDIVKQNILAGNSYLTNLTCKVPISTNLSLEELYACAHAPYKLWLKEKLLCFSPEIFVRIKEGQISSHPMKGTIDATLPDAKQQLMDDPKEAAEHATIVDLIRNDLSMVAKQVNVKRYRYCERLETNKGAILQTSSEICGNLPDDYPAHIGDILFRLLPAGSITGAPKPATVGIIESAEGYERGFYTGVMGICDGRTLDSAVMIRFIAQEKDRLYYKTGGGITSQSDPVHEYAEMIQKIYVPVC